MFVIFLYDGDLCGKYYFGNFIVIVLVFFMIFGENLMLYLNDF